MAQQIYILATSFILQDTKFHHTSHTPNNLFLTPRPRHAYKTKTWMAAAGVPAQYYGVPALPASGLFKVVLWWDRPLKKWYCHILSLCTPPKQSFSTALLNMWQLSAMMVIEWSYLHTAILPFVPFLLHIHLYMLYIPCWILSVVLSHFMLMLFIIVVILFVVSMM